MKKLHYLLLLLPILVWGQDANQNYIKTKAYKDSSSVSINDTIAAKVTVNITYFDGLGRPIQQVALKQTPLGKDVVMPIVYDSVGRTSKKYLPLSSSWDDGRFTGNDTIVDNIITDYTTLFGTDGANAYSETLFEASPLSRALEQAAPGEDWMVGNDHTIKYDYTLNLTTTAERVRLFTAVADWDGDEGVYKTDFGEDGSNYYAADQLFVTIMKDENWTSGKSHTTEEYKNMEGQVVLKRSFTGSTPTALNTYYVYDQFGNLTYVIPPAVTGTITETKLEKLCYQYAYDDRNRLAEKQLPGKRREYIVYDKLDRIVMSGPARNPFDGSNDGWLVTRYERFGRVAYTGWKAESDLDGAMRKGYADDFETDTYIFEEKADPANTMNSVTVGYSMNTPVNSDYHILMVNYYDDYNYPDAPSSFGSLSDDPMDVPVGLPTGSWVRALQTSSDYNGESSAVAYDKKYRPIYTQKVNYLGGGTKTYSTLGFAGNVLRTVLLHKRLDTDDEIMVKDSLTYDKQLRPLAHFHQAGSGDIERLSLNEYDALGRLIRKNVGGPDDGSNVLQKADYRFNIRGWMTNINSVDTLQVGSDPRDLFAFKLSYNNPEDATAQFNGNISEAYWMTDNDNVLRKYEFTYDKLNRMTNAEYSKPDEASVNSYGEEVGYDLMGNITDVTRYGAYDDPTEQRGIDKLAYFYDTDNPNLLLKVTDETNNPNGFNDDSDGTDDYTDDYDYDDDGNMIKDENKDITSIAYNHLGLPVLIKFGTAEMDKIEYLYDAAGRKLGKKVSWQPEGLITIETKTTDYLDGFQYEQEHLQFFPTSEGYAKDTFFDDEHHFNYVYQYKDHLGNVRVSYGWNPTALEVTILEENNYYPYGLKHRNYNMTESDYKVLFPSGIGIEAVDSRPYNYKYNGKEWQGDLGLNMYDMDLRDYDPAIGRWVCIDPVVHFGQSTYNAFDGNPVYWADPSGGDSVDGLTASGAAAVSIYNGIISAMNAFNGEGFSIGGVLTGSDAEEYNNAVFGLDGVGGGGSLVKPGPFEVWGGATENGAFIIIEFTDPGWGYKQYNWIQSVSSSGEFQKARNLPLYNTHIDGPRDRDQNLVNYPFIYGGDTVDQHLLGVTSKFSDLPRGESCFEAEVTLVGIKSDGSITALGSFSWGYSIDSYLISNFIEPSYSPSPSSFQEEIINIYNKQQ